MNLHPVQSLSSTDCWWDIPTRAHLGERLTPWNSSARNGRPVFRSGLQTCGFCSNKRQKSCGFPNSAVKSHFPDSLSRGPAPGLRACGAPEVSWARRALAALLWALRALSSPAPPGPPRQGALALPLTRSKLCPLREHLPSSSDSVSQVTSSSRNHRSPAGADSGSLNSHRGCSPSLLPLPRRCCRSPRPSALRAVTGKGKCQGGQVQWSLWQPGSHPQI